jgi:hypothetical protein
MVVWKTVLFQLALADEFNNKPPNYRSWDNVVGIPTGYGLDQISSPGRVRILSSPRRSDRLWGSSSLLSYGYRGLFLRD